jgi:acetyl esterase/lipase
MTPDRRTVLGLGAAVAAGSGAVAAAQPEDPKEAIRLWPSGAPGGERVTVSLQIVERSPDPALYRDRFAVGITDPLLTVFRPARPEGASLLIAPGGGFQRVVIDKEGFEAARRFAEAGVTCFVLRYRLPADGWAAGPDAPLQDAQRALRLIRQDAGRRGLDPDRVSVLGFSAGGHVAASLATLHARSVYDPVDEADRLSAKPMVAGLMYPVITMEQPFAHPMSRRRMLGDAPTEAQVAAYSRERSVSPDTPPAFLVQALNDPDVPIENSQRMFDALRAANLPCEFHRFEEGGHGFGIRLAQDKPCAAWPDLFLAWARRHGAFRAG